MLEFLGKGGSSASLIALGAIALANVIIWFAGGQWTPQKRAYVGIASALIVFGVGYWANAAAFPSTREGLVTLIVAALVLVLAAAGAPVYKETFFTGRQADPAGVPQTDSMTTTAETTIKTEAERPGRTWGVWSR